MKENLGKYRLVTLDLYDSAYAIRRAAIRLKELGGHDKSSLRLHEIADELGSIEALVEKSSGDRLGDGVGVVEEVEQEMSDAGNLLSRAKDVCEFVVPNADAEFYKLEKAFLNLASVVKEAK